MGVKGGIPTNRTEYTNLVTAGGDPTGGTSVSTLLNSLLSSAPSNTYIRVPSNTLFKLSSALTLPGGKKGVSIVGDNRTAEFFHEGAFFGVDNHSFQAPIRITSHLAKGETNFTTASAISTDYLGARCRISAKNEGRTNGIVYSSSFSDRLVNQWPDIVNITDGTNITIWPPILYETALNLDPWIHVDAANLNEYFGVENLTITKSNRITAATGNDAVPFPIFGGRNWWVRNCTVINRHASFTFNLSQNTWFEIRDSDFIMAASGSGTATIIFNAEGQALVENNSSQGASPFEQANNASGCVIGYNYVTNAVSDDTHVGNAFDIHQPHSHNNYWEGNDGSMYQADQYHGTCSFQCKYRNRFSGFDPVKHGLRRAMHMGRGADYDCNVANDLGTTRTNFNYTTTNQFWTGIQGVIFNLGFPNPGNSSYGYNVAPGHHRAVTTLDVHRLFPGTNFQVGVVTQATSLTNEIHGNFENGLYGSWPSVANGDKVVFGNSTDDYFWFLNTNSTLLLASSHTSSKLTLNKPVWVSNSAKIYLHGPESQPWLDLVATNSHFYEANWDSTNNAVMWSGSTNLAGLPKSLYRGDEAPSFFNGMHYPPFGIATEGDTAKTNKLPAEIRLFALTENTHTGEQEEGEGEPSVGGSSRGGVDIRGGLLLRGVMLR